MIVRLVGAVAVPVLAAAPPSGEMTVGGPGNGVTKVKLPDVVLPPKSPEIAAKS